MSGSDGNRNLNDSLLTDSVSVCVGTGVAPKQPGSKDQNKTIDSDVHGDLYQTKMREGDAKLVSMLVCLHSDPVK